MKRAVLLIFVCLVTYLISSGCSQNKAKALHEAVIDGDSTKVVSLLDDGVDVNVIYKGGTALYLAAYEGHLNLVNVLLNRGANVDAKDDPYGNTALGAAVYKNDRSIVKRLIEAGADVNMRDRDGFTTLMIAVANADDEIVMDLLEAGADPNVRDRQNRTALQWARDLSKSSIVRLLSSWKGPAAKDTSEVER